MKPRIPPSYGTCALCRKQFSRSSMGRHLAACPARPEGSSRRIHLTVTGGPLYWMHIAVRATATLATLDRFLRRAWMECCNHISLFTIGGQRYSSTADELGDDPYDAREDAEEEDLSMGAVKLDKLPVGARFVYAYDLGSTTEVDAKVVGPWLGPPDKADVVLLALNEPPEYPCDSCPETAWGFNVETQAFLCWRCNQAAGLDETLPLVNSPRAGVCGYTGPPITLPEKAQAEPPATQSPATKPPAKTKTRTRSGAVLH